MAHAARLIAELIGDAFIEAVERSRRDSWGRARAAWRWILERTEAPPGIELSSPDGSTYTGIVVVEQNQAVLLLAFSHRRSPVSMSGISGYGTSGSTTQLFEESEPDDFDLFRS